MTEPDWLMKSSNGPSMVLHTRRPGLTALPPVVCSAFVELLSNSCLENDQGSVTPSSPEGPVFSVVAGDSGLRLIGELDIAGVPLLRASLDPLEGQDIIIDCSRLTFIDCSALSVLIEYYHRCEQTGSRLILSAPSRPLTRLLELTDLEELFQVRASN